MPVGFFPVSSAQATSCQMPWDGGPFRQTLASAIMVSANASHPSPAMWGLRNQPGLRDCWLVGTGAEVGRQGGRGGREQRGLGRKGAAGWWLGAGGEGKQRRLRSSVNTGSAVARLN